MEVLAVGNKRLNTRVLRHAVDVLEQGGLVIFPTETSYGVAADALNPKAVAAVRRLKGRGPKPIAVITDSLAMTRRYFHVDRTSQCLAEHFWPGPLTMILPVRTPRLARAQLSSGRVGVRVSAHPVARALARGLKRPITATSANRSGADACFSLAQFVLQFRGKRQPDLFLDAGALPRRAPSTLVAVEDGDVRVLRRGGLRIRADVCSRF